MNWRPWRRASKPGKSAADSPHPGDEQFPGKVFATEIKYLAERRKSAHSGHDHQVAADAQPSSENNLVGLALSGGGIRSATFNLGLLQSLHSHGAFRQVDYLSTVSGGGFLGSSLSTLMSQNARRGEDDKRGEFPFPHSDQKSEVPAVTYLRNNSNYLAPNGLLDYLRIVGVLLRGILLNFLVLGPLILVSSMILILIYGQPLLDRMQEDDNLQRLDALLEHKWTGMENLEDATVASLTDSIEDWSLLAANRGKQTKDLLRSLTGPKSGSPLIVGGPGNDPASYRFRSDATRKKIVRALWDSGALQNQDALEEIAALDEALEKAGRSETLAQLLDELVNTDAFAGKDEVHAVPQWLAVASHDGPRLTALEVRGKRRDRALTALRGAGLVGGRDGKPGDPPADSSGARAPPSRLAGSWRLSLTSPDGQLIQLPLELGADASISPQQSSSTPAALSASMGFAENTTRRQVVHELYVQALIRPNWLEEKIGHPWNAPPLAYWEFVGLTRVREKVKNRPSDQIPCEASEFPSCVGGPGYYICVAQECLTKQSWTNLCKEPSLLEERDCPGSYSPRYSEFKTAIQPIVTAAGENKGAADAARNLYYGGLVDAKWFGKSHAAAATPPHDVDGEPGIGPLPGADDEPGLGNILTGKAQEFKQRAEDELEALEGTDSRLESLAYRQFQPAKDSNPWNPYQIRLPYTVGAGLFCLIWIGLFPLLLWLRRLLSHLWSQPKRTRWGLSCLLLLAASPLFLIGLVWIPALIFVFAGSFSREGVITGIALIIIAYLLVRRLRRLKSALWWRDLYERSFSSILILTLGVAWVELQPYLIYHYKHLELDISWTVFLGAASLLSVLSAGPAMAVLKRASKTVAMVVVGLLGPVLPLLVYIHVVLFSLYSDSLWSGLHTLDNTQVIFTFLRLALLFHVINLPLDVNSTSLHSFYRDRLSRAYLIGRGEDNEIRPEDDLSLRDICPEGSGAPYHLVNVSLNLQGTSDPAIRQRHSDFFTFSRDYVGGARTGYCRTQDMERVFPHLHLSSAVAVSAAAAAPNMGTFTFGPLVVVMALLNIRLGFWLPNPSRVNRWTRSGTSRLRRFGRWIGFRAIALAGSFRARPGAYSLLKEMLSLMHDRSRFVNLSDGGHIENTGAYELLRRRCRFIIIGDGEADPQMRLGALATLMRYARIDLGIEIKIHLDDLRTSADGQSRQHCAIGVIHYPGAKGQPPESGLLLYVKASLTGDEDQVVAEYQARSEGFPHESTADQSFSEGQFEAYRDLGFHIGEGLFGQSELLGNFEEFSLWFQKLRVTLSPGLASHLVFSEISKELAAIDEMLRGPGVEPYFYEIYPDLRPEGDEPAATSISGEAFRDVFNLVGRQLRLMQTLFVTLELGQKGNLSHPSNRGWMNLFHRWAEAPTFKRVYLRTISTYSGPFQQFCESGLGLGLRLSWLGVKRRELLHPRVDPATEQDEPLEIGRLVARVEGCREKLHIGRATLHSGRVTVTMRKGYEGTGMVAKAELALERWATDHKVPIKLERPLISLSEADEVPPLDRSQDGEEA